MTMGWIGERMGMETRGHLNHLLYRKRKTGGVRASAGLMALGTARASSL